STLLLVHVISSIVTGATYAGLPMTLGTSSTRGENYTYYLINPTSGTNNVVVSFSGSTQSVSSAVSYTGTDTSNPFRAISNGHDQSDTPSPPITTPKANPIIDDNLYHDLPQTLPPNSPQVSQYTAVGKGAFSHGPIPRLATTTGAYTL